MHIGCCENCRYVDLLEYLTGGCPRCGGRMAPLGIRSAEWNEMTIAEREAAVSGMFPKGDGPEPPESRYEEAEGQYEEAKAEAYSAPVPDEEPPVSDGQDEEPPVSDEQDEEPAEEGEETEPSDDGIEYIYVCYKCSSVAVHDSARERYFCAECGGDMVKTACRADEWAAMSKEEKRDASEEAKIRHMVTEIKKAGIDEEESEKTQNIINVV